MRLSFRECSILRRFSDKKSAAVDINANIETVKASMGSPNQNSNSSVEPTGPAQCLVSAPFNPNSPALTSSRAPNQVFAERKAYIYQPARSAMQSGRQTDRVWVLEFNPDVPRWRNPLIGWTSSRDSVQALQLKFETLEAAVQHARDQGWAFEVHERPVESKLRPKSYAENFLYSSGKLKIIKTK